MSEYGLMYGREIQPPDFTYIHPFFFLSKITQLMTFMGKDLSATIEAIVFIFSKQMKLAFLGNKSSFISNIQFSISPLFCIALTKYCALRITQAGFKKLLKINFIYLVYMFCLIKTLVLGWKILLFP